MSDDPYMFSNCTAEDLGLYFASVYRYFDRGLFRRLLKDFGLDPARRTDAFSKGMKKELALILAVSGHSRIPVELQAGQWPAIPVRSAEVQAGQRLAISVRAWEVQAGQRLAISVRAVELQAEVTQNYRDRD